MITITTRPYSESEKKQLVTQLPSLYGRIKEFVIKFIFILMIFLLPFLFLDKYVHFSSGFQLVTIVIFLILTTLITQRITKKYEGGFSNRKAIEDMQTGQVEMLHVQTSRAIKRDDPEDFGVAFYIEVKDGEKNKCLYLCGQYLDELEDDHVFPNTEFIITRRLDIKELIDIRLLGKPFKPEKTLPAFSKEVWKSGTNPANGELLHKTLDEII